jgi:phospholipid/cholesterol/gamma-HCH transport system ATP-binding protein
MRLRKSRRLSAPRPAPSRESAGPAPLIEIRDLVKRFGQKMVLDGVSLSVERGETVVVIGGSGSGKTTLARLLVGLERPTSGEIRLDGVDLVPLSEAELGRMRRRFAMVFQKYALLDSLSVFDNVAFPLREETDLDEAAIHARVMAALRELGIEDAVAKLPGELSGGMAKRVGIARAIVIEPEILVYDEPTSGLDPITSRVVDGLIEHMRERFFVTSVVITHDMVTAYHVADRVLLLAAGKIVADGPPEVVFTSHRDDIQAFAVASGVDLAELAARRSRKPPDQIRALWAAAQAPPPSGPREGTLST